MYIYVQQRKIFEQREMMTEYNEPEQRRQFETNTRWQKNEMKWNDAK